MSVESLRRELLKRSAIMVPFTDWGAFILGHTRDTPVSMMPAGDVARRELERWRNGRFPTIQLAVADSVFSKTRKYEVVVRTCIRPFAAAYGSMPLELFCGMKWQQIYRTVFGSEPGQGSGKQSHLSDESRVRSVLEASQAFLDSGILTPSRVREISSEAGGESSIRRILGSARGIGPALQAYALMNLGILTLKADRHIIRVVAPHLGLAAHAPPSEYERRLRSLETELGFTAFEVDQILWHTESSRVVSGCGSVPDSATEAGSSLSAPLRGRGADGAGRVPSDR